MYVRNKLKNGLPITWGDYVSILDKTKLDESSPHFDRQYVNQHSSITGISIEYKPMKGTYPIAVIPLLGNLPQYDNLGSGTGRYWPGLEKTIIVDNFGNMFSIEGDNSQGNTQWKIVPRFDNDPNTGNLITYPVQTTYPLSDKLIDLVKSIQNELSFPDYTGLRMINGAYPQAKLALSITPTLLHAIAERDYNMAKAYEKALEQIDTLKKMFNVE